MANALTYNQVIDIMQDIAQRHYLINTFMLGKDWELENNQDIQYPLLQVYPETARLPQVNGDYKTINITLVCKVIDLVRQAEENERDVHSDCLQIAQDIVNEINQHPYYQYSNANLIGDIDFTSLEEFDQNIGGTVDYNYLQKELEKLWPILEAIKKLLDGLASQTLHTRSMQRDI